MNASYSTVTFKVFIESTSTLLNWPQRKLGQSCTNMVVERCLLNRGDQFIKILSSISIYVLSIRLSFIIILRVSLWSTCVILPLKLVKSKMYKKVWKSDVLVLGIWYSDDYCKMLHCFHLRIHCSTYLYKKKSGKSQQLISVAFTELLKNINSTKDWTQDTWTKMAIRQTFEKYFGTNCHFAQLPVLWPH